MGTRLRPLAVPAVVVLLALASAPAAIAGALAVEVAPTATLISRGEAVLVTLTVECPSGSQALEAFVYVVQDGNTSQFAGVPVRCNDRAHRYVVMVHASPDAPFHSGAARVSGYFLVGDGQTYERASPSQDVVIR